MNCEKERRQRDYRDAKNEDYRSYKSPMADPASRRSATLNRLRLQLQRKRESLAHHFDFRMYIAFVFKDKKKKSALFQVTDVVPVMTNNYEDSILKGVQEDAYTLESSQELLGKDVVQLHAPRYQSMRKDVIGCIQDIDFFLWPRKDIEKIVCLLFSRWKGDRESEFRPIEAKFEFEHLDYEKQLLKLVNEKDQSGLIINNPSESMFIFVDRHHLQTPRGKVVVFKISSVCLYLPQEELTHWGPGLKEDVLAPFMPG